MRTPNIYRWVGISSVAVAVTMLFEAFTQLVDGGRPGLHDPTGLADYFQGHQHSLLLIIVIDTILMSALVVFFACFRQLVTKVRPDLAWIADIGYGAGLVFVAVTLVGDGMGGGAALDASGDMPDPVIIRALTEGHMLMFGTIGCMLTAMVLISAGYLTFASGVLPRWTGVVAYVAAVLNLLVIPTTFGGTDETSLFSVGGWANAFLATFPFLLWVILVGVHTIRGRARHEPRVAAEAAKAVA